MKNRHQTHHKTGRAITALRTRVLHHGRLHRVQNAASELLHPFDRHNIGAAELATFPKYVLIAAPHTSNWDFPITLMVCFALRLRVRWMAKASLFAFPLGPLARWLGGIAIDRSVSSNTVAATIDSFVRTEQLVVIVAPEGTRGKVARWKTGFYHIAHGAQVPIGLAFLDYRRKVGGIGAMFRTTGDLATDMRDIERFYSHVTGKNSDQFDAGGISGRD